MELKRNKIIRIKIKLELSLQKQRGQKEHEFKMKDLELVSRSSRITQLPSDIKVDSFDAAKKVRLVPKFQEIKVDKFLLNFEKIAF